MAGLLTVLRELHRLLQPIKNPDIGSKVQQLVRYSLTTDEALRKAPRR